MRCPSCSSSAVLHDTLRGEHICTRCGLVLMERSLELKPEWRRRPGEKLERADVTAGIDVTQHDFGLGGKFSVSKDIPPKLARQPEADAALAAALARKHMGATEPARGPNRVGQALRGSIAAQGDQSRDKHLLSAG